jgi:protoporphyrinogen/coproporphyrinogen III oxidase
MKHPQEHTMSTDFDHIVIGAGISGLGAAHFASRRGHRTLVLESVRSGRRMHQQPTVSAARRLLDRGRRSHLLQQLRQPTLDPRRSRIDRAGPAQGQGRLSALERRQRGSIISALHPWEALLSLPKIFSIPKEGRSVSDYYGELLGRRNYRDLLRHAFQAVVCQPADDYPAEALFRRKPRRKDVIKAFTFSTGLSAIPTAIAGAGADRGPDRTASRPSRATATAFA